MLCLNLCGWARAANAVTSAVGVPAGMFRLVAGPGMVLVVSEVSNSIHPCIPAGLELICT